jgi:hypothetical protein
METPRRFGCVLLLVVPLLVAGPAAADPVLVEFRSSDGTALVADGDARTPWGIGNPEVARKRVAARAEAIATARDVLLATLPADLAAGVDRSYRNFPLVAMDVDDVGRRALLAHPLVVAVHDVQFRRPLMQSALAYVGADAWHGEGFEGEGTAVAVLDTGIRYWNGHFGDCPERGTAPATGADCRVRVPGSRTPTRWPSRSRTRRTWAASWPAWRPGRT